MLPIDFNYIFVHVRQTARLRPELSPKFLSTLGLNPARIQLKKPGPTYNSEPGVGIGVQKNRLHSLFYWMVL